MNEKEREKKGSGMKDQDIEQLLKDVKTLKISKRNRISKEKIIEKSLLTSGKRQVKTWDSQDGVGIADSSSSAAPCEGKCPKPADASVDFCHKSNLLQ